MSDVSQILSRLDSGDPEAAAQLLPLVYDELRRLAAVRLQQESAGQTLQATALVHEAYLRLVQGDHSDSYWDNRAHFFAAAAEAMRRILVEAARKKRQVKRGGGRVREAWEPDQIEAPEPREDLVALDEALEKLTVVDPQAAELVKLRYFAGFTLQAAAELLQIPTRTADRRWAYARAWLHQEISTS